MAKRPKKRGQRAMRSPAPTLGETSIAHDNDAIGRNALLLQDMYRAEVRAMTAERQLADIRAKLVRLLSPDQIDAAKTCGVTPEFYALECIELCKESFFPHMPAELRPLWELKGTGGFGYSGKGSIK